MSVLELELRRMTSAERTKAPAFFDEISTSSNRIIVWYEDLEEVFANQNPAGFESNISDPIRVCLFEALGRTTTVCHT